MRWIIGAPRFARRPPRASHYRGGQRSQLVTHGRCCLVAELYREFRLVEGHGLHAGIIEVRNQQDILWSHQGYLLLGIAPRQDGGELPDQREHVRHRFAPGKRGSDIDDDEPVHAHRLHDIDRNVLGDAAIDQQLAIELDRGKKAGIDMLARIATARSPLARITGSPLTISVAIARNGIGSWSKSCTSETCATRSCNSKLRC